VPGRVWLRVAERDHERVEVEEIVGAGLLESLGTSNDCAGVREGNGEGEEEGEALDREAFGEAVEEREAREGVAALDRDSVGLVDREGESAGEGLSALGGETVWV